MIFSNYEMRCVYYILINIFIVVGPVLSTWVALSSSLEDGFPEPELLSTTSLVM